MCGVAASSIRGRLIQAVSADAAAARSSWTGRRHSELIGKNDHSSEILMQPLVSILIPCYNSEQWIGHAIESALGQTWSNKQVIVLDDGSTDDSLNVIRRYESHLRWETGQNRGGGYARNRLLELASGEWVQYLDADDYLLAEKVTEQAEFVVQHPEVDVVIGPTTMEFWSEQGVRHEQIALSGPHDYWTMLASWKLPQTGAPLWKRSAILDVGGWKRDQPCCQEHELYLRLLTGGKKFAYHSSGGSIYRQWSDQTVCKRDIPEVHRRRLEIERKLEEFLSSTGQLTPARLRAISQARFEMARNAWQYDRTVAAGIMKDVRKSDPKFSPTGEAAPSHYKFVFRACGFNVAEGLAAAARGVFR
jgi:glycosyltransferase involved in cell wall biosynthesis